MGDKRKLEFFLLRYVPDAVKGEFVNFGLAMIEAPESRAGEGFADARFLRNRRRLLCFDPQADLDLLQAIETDIRRRVVEIRNCEEVIRTLNDSLSNAIQLSGSQGCLTEDPAKELEEMARYYLEPARLIRDQELSGREKIVLEMQEQWELAGIASLIKPFPVAMYTGIGDRFTFDFSYIVGSNVKIFHAVSLKARVDTAVTVAARYPEIAGAMGKAEHFPLIASLTAVVDNDLDKNTHEIQFALGMMRDKGIRVAEVREMPTIAMEAKRDMGM